MVSRKLEEAHGLSIVLRQNATTFRVREPENELRAGMSFISGELVIVCGLTFILRQPAIAACVSRP